MKICIKNKKIIAAIALMMTLFFTFGNIVSVRAESLKNNIVTTQNGVVDFMRGTASISIAGNGATKSLAGKTFRVYQLFHAENAVGMESVNYTFCDNSKFALQNIVGKKLGKIPTEVTEYEVIDYIQSLNEHKVEGADAQQTEEGYESEFRYFVEELRSELENLNMNAADEVYAADTNDSGEIILNGLEYGYYLIDEITDNQGSHSASSLCMVNTANPDSEIKIKSDYPSVTIKIQEDDDQESIGNQGWNDMADYEIGQRVPYKVESDISNMNGYDTYYYAWHHMMDSALDFDPDSVKIVISDENREYELTEQEFSVAENVEGESFVISIEDLKKLVDEQFPLTDENGHHSYGQKITLTYSAIVDEQAAENMGIPGFHNEVRLEFSNDPDSDGKEKTGYTPWDWVVCFTYGVNGLKVNNHELALENAKFRLYLDESCTEEVSVTKTEKGYIVHHNADEAEEKNHEEIVSDRNGEFTFYGLDAGTYYLKETEAPDGYRVLKDPIRIRIQAKFADDRNNYAKGDSENKKALLEVHFFAHVKEFLDGILKENETELTVDAAYGTANLTVVNTAGSKLPATGSSATLAILGAGMILMTAAVVRNRNKHMYD